LSGSGSSLLAINLHQHEYLIMDQASKTRNLYDELSRYYFEGNMIDTSVGLNAKCQNAQIFDLRDGGAR
jgi:hypothetical protein